MRSKEEKNDLNDPIGYGILAMTEALLKLDESKNPEGYLRLRIKGAIYDYLQSPRLQTG
jgi:RNA polymerase sigma factor for flagellar operon FliA